MTTPADFKHTEYDGHILTNAPTTEDNPIKSAWDNLTKAMVDDPDWAWSVQCNLAMPIMDQLHCSHKAANLTAAALMRHIFHYDITTHKHYQDLINYPNKTKSLSDKFDPDYAKFGIRDKYDLVSDKPMPVDPEIPFHQKVKEYFIEHAYYSNKQYPSILFMIGESFNNDSTFKTIKVGSWETGTLIIPNDELNFDDFKFVSNPAGGVAEETSATCDATDFLSNLTNRIKSLDVPSDDQSKDNMITAWGTNIYSVIAEELNQKGTEIVNDQTHREKVLSFFKHGMTYLKKQRDNFHYVYCDDLSSYKRFVFRCKSPDIRDGAFITFDLEDLDPNDWQHIDDATIEESNKLQPIETTMNPITSRIEQLNPETKESLFNLLKIRNFFKSNGVYQCNKIGILSTLVKFVYSTTQPHIDKLSFNRIGIDFTGIWAINIEHVDLNDWVFLGMNEPIDLREESRRHVIDFFKPGRFYYKRPSFTTAYFTFDEYKGGDTIAGVRYDFLGTNDRCFLVIDQINLNDWVDITNKMPILQRAFSE